MNSSNAIRLAVRKAMYAGAIATAATGVSTVAMAQEEGAEAVEEIVVTGSRIARKDFTSNAPVATVDAEQITLTNTINTESLLNTLPQAVPGLDRTSNNPGNGTATVDLRGLGSNRTLVLINGRRLVPTTPGGSVDINSIPNALIENIEVLTGGASAIYGSDAVAGVVNFILKDDFEGVQVGGGYEITQEGDAGVYSADITLGANLADDRGNVTLSLAYTEREDLFQGDRDFSTFAQFDGDGVLFNGGSSGVPQTSIFAAGLGDFSPDSFGILFNQDGTIRPFDTTGDDSDFYNYAPENYIQLPQTRYQATAMGHFDISEKATVFGSAMFTSSAVPQQLAPTPIFQTATFTLDGSPFIDPTAQQILSDALGDGVDTDGDGIDDTATAFLRRRLEEVGPRVSDDKFTTYQVQGGLRGQITDNWSYDGYIQFGNVTNSSNQLGNVNRDRFNQALLVTDANNCVDPSANGATIGCSPMNLFGQGNISPDAAAFLRTAVASVAEFDQLIVAANVAGDLGDLELPGGEIGIAFGVEHIENDFVFRPSQDLAAGTIAGFNGAPALGGGFDGTGFYAEAYLPFASGAAFAEQLDLELAYRTTDYSTAGQVDAIKIAGSWAPNDLIRFRAGFNTANRAPSIGELFSPRAEGFPGAIDPCSNLAQDQSAGVAAICQATGVPAANVFSPALDLPSGQVRQISGGNPALIEESAETLTVGFVVTEVIEGLSLSVDYFDIEIEDFIAGFGGGAANVLNNCYDPTNPNGGAGSLFCNVVNRRADGSIDFIEIASQNVATQTLTGFDVLASYDTGVFGGDLRIDFVATVTEENDFVPFAGAEVIECAGKFGNVCGEPIPEYKHRVAFNWTRDDLTAQFVWRHVGEVDDDDDGTDFVIEKLDAENYLDAAISYSLTENYSFTFGIDNVFDTDPPIVGDNQEQANTFPATYDVFGRTFFLRAVASF